MIVAVRLKDSEREALIEFPTPPDRWRGAGIPNLRQPPQINDSMIVKSVRSALAAGWAPESRGKPFSLAAP